MDLEIEICWGLNWASLDLPQQHMAQLYGGLRENSSSSLLLCFPLLVTSPSITPYGATPSNTKKRLK